MRGRCAWSAAVLALACSTAPIQHRVLPAASNHVVTRVAIVPLPYEARSQRNVLSADRAKAASQIVTARVAEALGEWTRVEVVPPGDVELWLSTHPPDPDGLGLPRVGAGLRQAFGVDAVMSGRVQRFQAREGGERGATRPASVRFEVELQTPEGETLWEGSYDEVQSSVSQDVGSFSRASERGFRWVTAEALTRYGARELMRELGAVSSAWR